MDAENWRVPGSLWAKFFEEVQLGSAGVRIKILPRQ
jgi:hypothetical protein